LVFFVSAFTSVPHVKRDPILTGFGLLLADLHGIDRVDFPNRYALRIRPLVIVAWCVTPIVKQGSTEPNQPILKAIESVRSPRLRTEVRTHFGRYAVASVVVAEILYHLNVNVIGVFPRNIAVDGFTLALV
jgi:hypothetical protein